MLVQHLKIPYQLHYLLEKQYQKSCAGMVAISKTVTASIVQLLHKVFIYPRINAETHFP